MSSVRSAAHAPVSPNPYNNISKGRTSTVSNMCRARFISIAHTYEPVLCRFVALFCRHFGGLRQLSQRLTEGRARHASLSNNGRNVLRRSHIERGILHMTIVRRDLLPAQMR